MFCTNKENFLLIMKKNEVASMIKKLTLELIKYIYKMIRFSALSI